MSHSRTPQAKKSTQDSLNSLEQLAETYPSSLGNDNIEAALEESDERERSYGLSTLPDEMEQLLGKYREGPRWYDFFCCFGMTSGASSSPKLPKKETVQTVQTSYQNPKTIDEFIEESAQQSRRLE